MKTLLILLTLLIPCIVLGSLTEAEKTKLNKFRRVGRDVQLGTSIGSLEAKYDFSVKGGTIGNINLGAKLPDNSVITRCWYDVVTTFTSSSDAGKIAINLPTDGDLQASVAISGGSNVYDAGLHDCATKGDDPGDPSTFLKTTAERQLRVVVASEDITAGKMIIYLDYVVSE